VVPSHSYCTDVEGHGQVGQCAESIVSREVSILSGCAPTGGVGRTRYSCALRHVGTTRSLPAWESWWGGAWAKRWLGIASNDASESSCVLATPSFPMDMTWCSSLVLLQARRPSESSRPRSTRCSPGRDWADRPPHTLILESGR
jgi:hypothetical protein